MHDATPAIGSYLDIFLFVLKKMLVSLQIEFFLGCHTIEAFRPIKAYWLKMLHLMFSSQQSVTYAQSIMYRQDSTHILILTNVWLMLPFGLTKKIFHVIIYNFYRYFILLQKHLQKTCRIIEPYRVMENEILTFSSLANCLLLAILSYIFT